MDRRALLLVLLVVGGSSTDHWYFEQRQAERPAECVDQLLTSRFFGLHTAMDDEIERKFAEYYRLLALHKPSSKNREAIRGRGPKEFVGVRNPVCAERAFQSEEVEEQAHGGESPATLLDADATHLVASEMLESSGAFRFSGGTTNAIANCPAAP